MILSAIVSGKAFSLEASTSQLLISLRVIEQPIFGAMDSLTLLTTSVSFILDSHFICELLCL